MLRRFDGKPISGRLIYRRSERSLDVEPKTGEAWHRCLVNDVQIEIDEKMDDSYVWGLSARVMGVCKARLSRASGGTVAVCRWRRRARSVKAISERRKALGIGYDPSSQWLCIGDQSFEGQMIAFAQGRVLPARMRTRGALAASGVRGCIAYPRCPYLGMLARYLWGTASRSRGALMCRTASNIPQLHDYSALPPIPRARGCQGYPLTVRRYPHLHVRSASLSCPQHEGAPVTRSPSAVTRSSSTIPHLP